jgi:hypothetical protein
MAKTENGSGDKISRKQTSRRKFLSSGLALGGTAAACTIALAAGDPHILET